jgi:hypothetical protein
LVTTVRSFSLFYYSCCQPVGQIPKNSLHPNHPSTNCIITVHFILTLNLILSLILHAASNPISFFFHFSTPSSPSSFILTHRSSSQNLSFLSLSSSVTVRTEDSRFSAFLPSPALVFAVVFASLSLSFVAVHALPFVDPDLSTPDPRRHPHPSINLLV